MKYGIFERHNESVLYSAVVSQVRIQLSYSAETKMIHIK